MLPTEPGDSPASTIAGGDQDAPGEPPEARCRTALAALREQATAGALDAVVSGIKSLQEALRDPLLPPDAAAEIAVGFKGLELMAAMKATDMALRSAVAHAQADRKIERNQEIGVARGFLSRAIGLGADEKFKRAANMMIESAMLTGGVKQVGPTRAKPVEEAPAARQLAKSERREFKRYDTPLLNVAVAGKRLMTLDWSLGGMLVGSATSDQFPSGEVVIPIELRLPGPGSPLRVSVVAVRVEIRKGGLAVRFFDVTPEVGAFLRRAITIRGG